jgi:hypothetical protein
MQSRSETNHLDPVSPCSLPPLTNGFLCASVSSSKTTPLSSSYQRPSVSPLAAAGHSHAQPRVPRIPKTTSLDDALQYWEKGDVSLGLTTPLKMWSDIYQPSEYRSEAQKLSMIHIVRDEFVKHCNGNWEVFEQHYPGLRHEYTKLIKAVRNARIARGDLKPRHTRRH